MFVFIPNKNREEIYRSSYKINLNCIEIKNGEQLSNLNRDFYAIND